MRRSSLSLTESNREQPRATEGLRRSDMSTQYTIGIGSVGSGLWFSYDSGSNWRHIYKPIDGEAHARAVRVDPNNPRRILAAADRSGLFLSEDGGVRWFPLPSPIPECEIWSLTIDPSDSNRILMRSPRSVPSTACAATSPTNAGRPPRDGTASTR